MDSKKVEEAVTMADEALWIMLEKRDLKVYDSSGKGPEYARAVAMLAGQILLADMKMPTN